MTTPSSTSKQTTAKAAPRKSAVKRTTKNAAAKPAVAAGLPRQRASKKAAPAAAKPAGVKPAAAKPAAVKPAAVKPARKPAVVRAPRPLIALARRKDGRAMSFTERLSEKRHAQFNHTGPVCHSCRMHASQLAAAASASRVAV